MNLEGIDDKNWDMDQLELYFKIFFDIVKRNQSATSDNLQSKKHLMHIIFPKFQLRWWNENQKIFFLYIQKTFLNVRMCTHHEGKETHKLCQLFRTP